MNAIIAGLVVNILGLIVPIVQNMEFLIRNEMVLSYLGSEPFDTFLNIIAIVINIIIGIVNIFWPIANLHLFGRL